MNVERAGEVAARDDLVQKCGAAPLAEQHCYRCGAKYFSGESRIIHAEDVFFCFVIRSLESISCTFYIFVIQLIH